MSSKRTTIMFAGVTLAALVTLACLGWWSRAQLAPVGGSDRPVIVHIARGQGASAVARSLEEAGLIRSAPAFEMYLAWSGMGRRLKAGYFELSPAMSGQEMAERIASGQVAHRRITIPEGLRLEQIARRVEQSGLVTADELLAAAVPETIEGRVSFPPPPGPDLEGYLLPQTYEFTFGVSAAEIVRRMASELDAEFVRPNAGEIAASKLTLHEIITLASLVEREARVDEDRPKIAGVLMNRLARGMKLQCDPTCVYGAAHVGQVDRDDLPRIGRAEGHATFSRPLVDEDAAVVPEEAVRAVLGEVEVEIAVVVGVRPGDAEAVPRVAEKFRRPVGEDAAVIDE